MKEKLPGLTQLLVHHHVQEVIDEVTCGDRQYLANVNVDVQQNSSISQNTTDSFDKRSLEPMKCVRVGGGGAASMTTAMATKMCLGEGLFISTNTTPSPPPAVSMVTAIQNAGKIMKC